MPLSGFKMFTDTGEEFGPEFGSQFVPDIDPEMEAEFPQDPFPAEDPPSIHDPVPPPPPRKGAGVPVVTRAVEREVRQELDALVRLVALAWSVPDPECASVLSEQSKAIAEGLVGVLKRNPRLLASLRGTGWLGDWVALGLALSPVARAIYAHHIVRPAPTEDVTDGSDPTAPVVDYAAWIPRSGAGNGAPRA